MLAIALLSLALQVSPPEPGTHPFYFASGDESFVSVVTDAALSAAPKWSTDAEIPLTPQKAVEAARARFATWVPDANQWSVDSISIQSIGSHDDWIYRVQFRAPGPPVPGIGRLAPQYFQIMVLLNGIAVEPTRQPPVRRWPL